MEYKTCPICKRVVGMLRKDAIYCGHPCQMVAYRRRKRLEVLRARFRAEYPNGRTPSGQELWTRYGSHSPRYSAAMIEG